MWWLGDVALPGTFVDSGEREGGSNSVVEWQPSKLLVAGSIPVSRSSFVYPAARAAGSEVGAANHRR